MSERDAYIALAYFGKIPSLKGLPIIKRIGSATQFFNSATNALQSYGITSAMAGELATFRKSFNWQIEQAKLAALGINIITAADDGYPPNLRELPDAPYALFVRGTLNGLAKPSVAIVGTRRVSSYGQRVTEYFSKKLAESGATIISGLALGVDTAAHTACLEAGGVTIAILGGGLSDAALYPKNNLTLAKKIIAGGGALVSEFPPDFSPTKYTFPLRNRIIAGLSRGVLVTEAPERSGALITAYLALEYNRDCFAVPADLFKGNALGSNALLGAGARLAISPNDIAAEYGLVTKEKEVTTAPILQGTENQIYGLIKQTPRSIDELHQETGLDIPAISSMLSVMELNGILKNMGNGVFSI